MYRIAEEFFVSMNMSAMPPEFWSKSIFEEVPGRPVICQPSAWDFCNGIDYRLNIDIYYIYNSYSNKCPCKFY